MAIVFLTALLGALLFGACGETDKITPILPASTPTAVPIATSAASPTQTPPSPTATSAPEPEEEVREENPVEEAMEEGLVIEGFEEPVEEVMEVEVLEEEPVEEVIEEEAESIPTATPSQWPPPDATPEPDPTSTPQGSGQEEPEGHLPLGTTHTGDFRGTDVFHKGRGTALIIESAANRYTIRLLEFFVTVGPDLFVYLSPDPEDWARTALEVSALRGYEGTFDYDVPAGTDMSEYRSVVIWCKSFSFLFAVAPLTEL